MKRTTTAAVVAVALLAWPGVAVAAPPANDDFDDAIAVTAPLPFTDTVPGADATTAADDPTMCNDTGANVWYSFTPTRAGTYVAGATAEAVAGAAWPSTPEPGAP